MTASARPRAAVALGALLLVSLLAAQAHRVVALHAVCSRHGELIHLEAGPPRAATRPASRTFTAGATAAFEGAHGCTALLLLSTALVAPDPAALATTRYAKPGPRTAGPKSDASLPIPLLLQAPKHSPPSA